MSASASGCSKRASMVSSSGSRRGATLALFVSTMVSCTNCQAKVDETFSFRAPNLDVNPFTGMRQIANWDLGGTAVAHRSFVRLTAESQASKGWITSQQPFTMTEWSAMLELRASGASPHLYGDGLAIWLTKAADHIEGPGPSCHLFCPACRIARLACLAAGRTRRRVHGVSLAAPRTSPPPPLSPPPGLTRSSVYALIPLRPAAWQSSGARTSGTALAFSSIPSKMSTTRITISTRTSTSCRMTAPKATSRTRRPRETRPSR